MIYDNVLPTIGNTPLVRLDKVTSFWMTRELVRREGLFCGGSSGTACYAALQLARALPADKVVVVVLPDKAVATASQTELRRDRYATRHVLERVEWSRATMLTSRRSECVTLRWLWQ